MAAIGSAQEIQNTGNLKKPLRQDWEQTGNNTGNTGNISTSGGLSIPPLEPAALTLPVPQPALCPQTARGTNFVRLRPLRLWLVDAFLQDFRNRSAVFAFQPWSYHLLPGIRFVSSLLLIACKLHQVERVEPPNRARLEPCFGFRPQLVAVSGQTFDIDLTTHDRPETAPSGLIAQITAVVDSAGEHALAR
jgi:hypothetical protein